MILKMFSGRKPEMAFKVSFIAQILKGVDYLDPTRNHQTLHHKYVSLFKGKVSTWGVTPKL